MCAGLCGWSAGLVQRRNEDFLQGWHDTPFVGMSALAPERETILIIDPETVTARAIALQQLEQHGTDHS